MAKRKKKAGVSEAGQTEADADAQALDSKQMRLHHDQGHGRDAGDQGRMAQTAPHGPSRADTCVVAAGGAKGGQRRGMSTSMG